MIPICAMNILVGYGSGWKSIKEQLQVVPMTYIHKSPMHRRLKHVTLAVSRLLRLISFLPSGGLDNQTPSTSTAKSSVRGITTRRPFRYRSNIPSEKLHDGLANRKVLLGPLQPTGILHHLHELALVQIDLLPFAPFPIRCRLNSIEQL